MWIKKNRNWDFRINRGDIKNLAHISNTTLGKCVFICAKPNDKQTYEYLRSFAASYVEPLFGSILHSIYSPRVWLQCLQCFV